MRFGVAELTDLADILRTAAQTEIMPRFRRLGADGARQKTGPLDLVTEADEAAERVITAGIARRFAGAVVVGEEATSADPSRLALLADADLAFVVDPVDGTANFAAGLPLFGVMAAAIVRGEVVAAAIHDPICDDMALALRGEGAWTESPGGRRTDLRVGGARAGSGDDRQCLVALSSRSRSAAPSAQTCRGLAVAGTTRCAAHEYRMACAGQCHLLFFNRLMPWDHAPGWLLHQEAGGYSARLDGSDYTPLQTDGGLICAPDRASWQAVRTILLQVD